jgi:predicted ArsR family transcriptional regulator
VFFRKAEGAVVFVTPDDFDARVSSVAALGEPMRRALYRYVIAQSEPVSRERAAAALGVPHHVAKFHLDRLEEDGLLDVEYSRPPGRTGPGAGRPAKLYRRSSRHIEVSLPEHRYDLVGQIMAEAIETARDTGTPVAEALSAVARATGRRTGHDGDDLMALLANNGFEPRRTGDRIRLANCPFHSLAERHTELVCGINLDFISGVLDAVPSARCRARLDPGPGRCCVSIQRT